jgi:hypothetical protein
MLFAPTKYNLGDKVFANTKNGMEACVITRVLATMSDDGQRTYYYINHGYDGYDENQLWQTIQTAKRKLKDNADQLQLSIS